MAKSVRVSYTLPPEIVSDLAFISERVGVSRSAILADVLGEPLHDLRALLESAPPKPTKGDMLRLRGKSEDIIEQRLSELRSVWDDGEVAP